MVFVVLQEKRFENQYFWGYYFGIRSRFQDRYVSFCQIFLRLFLQKIFVCCFFLKSRGFCWNFRRWEVGRFFYLMQFSQSRWKFFFSVSYFRLLKSLLRRMEAFMRLLVVIVSFSGAFCIEFFIFRIFFRFEKIFCVDRILVLIFIGKGEMFFWIEKQDFFWTR